MIFDEIYTNITKFIDGALNPKPQMKQNQYNQYNQSQGTQPDSVRFNTESSSIRLTPVLPPYKYNNTVNGIQFNSQ